jgi:hypothetical protein
MALRSAGGGSSVDLASPGTIGGTTPGAGNFTKVALTPEANDKAITVASHTQTANNPIFDAAQTWDSAGVTFTGYKVNITNTNSAAASKLFDFQLGGTTLLALYKSGVIGNTSEGTGIQISGTTLIGKDGGNEMFRIQSGRITTTVNAIIGISNSATSADGGNVDVGWSRKAAKVWEVNDGAKGSYVGTAFGASSQTVAQLPAASTAGAGARSFVTDANATTFLSTVAGGGANAVPVVSNGTDWVIA